ncbi:MAG: hypothetical protein K0R57_98 [Paenibacillaceae bacterium]|jgi:predicted DNA-binding transcriptional regulator YafY|nr:hypothetical protein [Paenibacillaceae bacterium]
MRLSMLWMLRSKKKLTAEQITDSLEISIRTVPDKPFFGFCLV